MCFFKKRKKFMINKDRLENLLKIFHHHTNIYINIEMKSTAVKSIRINNDNIRVFTSHILFTEHNSKCF